MIDARLVRDVVADGASVVVALLTVFAFWTLCALVAHRQNLRRERRGLK